METVNGLEHILTAKPIVLTIGFFDGVHKGHQKVLHKTLQLADELKAAPVAMTFYPHPMTVLAPHIPVPLLSSEKEKEKIIDDMGFDMMIVISPDPDFLSKSAKEFLADLRKIPKLKGIVIGENFTFGRGAEGNSLMLKEYFNNSPVFVELIPSEEDGNGKVISSTEIRELILSGEMKKASDLLGRRYIINGDIVHGFKRGHRVTGFPTANLNPEPGKIIPKDGVYATKAIIHHRFYPAVTNVGSNPTFGNEEKSIETFIISFDENIYDAPFALEWADRIRDEIKFDTVDELKLQIKKDIDKAKLILQ